MSVDYRRLHAFRKHINPTSIKVVSTAPDPSSDRGPKWLSAIYFILAAGYYI